MKVKINLSHAVPEATGINDLSIVEVKIPDDNGPVKIKGWKFKEWEVSRGSEVPNLLLYDSADEAEKL